MAIVLANVHVDLVDEPADKLVTVMVIVVIELALTGTYPCYESLVINHTSIPF